MGMSDDLKLCVGLLAEESFGKESAEETLAFLGSDEDVLFDAFRNLVNVRKPRPAPKAFLEAQDRMLKERIETAGVTDASDLPRTPNDERISLWRGDITTLRADAIVNAANSQMLGCWIPGHHCIDNAIHTFAGVQLRAECDRLMREQGHPEPTGMAKVTPAYNLPSQIVVHTVGPIANGNPTDLDRALLADSYRSCLDAASDAGAESIAFCCISTGVFGFPQEEAAQIAVATVRDWLDANEVGGPNHASRTERAYGANQTGGTSRPDRINRTGRAYGANQADEVTQAAPTIRANDASSAMHVVFNVFSEADEAIYRKLLY